MLTEILNLILHFLLPSSTNLRLETMAADDHTRCLTLELTSTQLAPACPVCQIPTSRFHSSYTRTLADLPWADVAVQLHLNVRKCFCPNADCPRRIFTERVPALAAPWARRTARLATAHQHEEQINAGRHGQVVREPSASTSGRTATGRPTARLLWTLKLAPHLMSCPSVQQRASPSGSRSIPEWR